MRSFVRKAKWLLAILLLSQQAFADATVVPQVELGVLKIWKNVYQSGKNGTEYDYVKEGPQENLKDFMRFSVRFNPTEKHGLLFLWNPLLIEANSVTKKEHRFDNVTFPEGTPINASYDFGFTRLSYLYALDASHEEGLSLGASLQIRNADIGFRSLDGTLLKVGRDVGPVPTFKMLWNQDLGDSLFWGAEFDGIYAPVKYLNGSKTDVVGSFVDVSVRGGIQTDERHKFFAKVRLLGGGAKGTSKDPEPGTDGYNNNQLWTTSVTVGCAVLY